jgi:hypothetical protein
LQEPDFEDQRNKNAGINPAFTFNQWGHYRSPKGEIMALTANEITHYKTLYGPPPVLSTESTEDFDRIFDAVMIAVQPRNIIEFIPMRHFVCAEWMINRYIRHTALVLERKYIDLRRSWVAYGKDSGIGKNMATALVNKACKDGGHNFASLVDQVEGSDMTMKEIIQTPPKEMDHNRALEFSVTVQAQLNDMIVRQTAIRNDCLRQLELYRAGLGKDLEKATKEIVDAEISEVRSEPALIEAPALAPEQTGAQNDLAPTNPSQSDQ